MMFDRNSRPSSQLTDDSSVVTGRTSGYSTSTDSEEFEADDEAQLGPGPEAGPMTRESQVCLALTIIIIVVIIIIFVKKYEIRQRYLFIYESLYKITSMEP